MSDWYGPAGNWIGGRWTDPDAEPQHEAVNPANGRPIGSFAWSSRNTARSAIAAAREAADDWRRTPVWERAKACQNIADAIAMFYGEHFVAGLAPCPWNRPFPKPVCRTGPKIPGTGLF